MRHDDLEYERNQRWELEWKLTTDYAMERRLRIKDINGKPI